MSQRVTELLSTSGGTAALRRINFVPAQFPDAPSIPEGIDFIRLNDPLERPEEMAVKQPPQQLTPKKRPRELFRNEDVQLQWSSVRRMGAGLQNMGNTCFMNSVLQCLTHTPPLAEVLLSQRPLGLNNGVDVLRMTQQHVQRALQHRGGIVAPVAHARGLKRICRGFKLGRQEDAHEYLVAVLDAMHEGCLAGLPKLPPEVAHTSMIHRIFAGRMCSQVRCLECSFESNTFEPFFDISLDVTRAPSLVKALAHFVRADQLEGPNRYKCPKQQRMVRAEKSMRIERPPNVLVIQLKRFGWTNRGIKVSKQVEFETELDMSPFMRRRGPPQLYALYAVLVHAGHSTHCGHYYCYVRAPNGLWHCMDDTSVSQVSERVVLAQKAYILFYIRKSQAPVTPSTQTPQPAQAAPAQRAAQHAGSSPAGPAQQQPPASASKAAVAQPSNPAKAAAAAVPAAALDEPRTAGTANASSAAAAAVVLSSTAASTARRTAGNANAPSMAATSAPGVAVAARHGPEAAPASKPRLAAVTLSAPAKQHQELSAAGSAKQQQQSAASAVASAKQQQQQSAASAAASAQQQQQQGVASAAASAQQRPQQGAVSAAASAKQPRPEAALVASVERPHRQEAADAAAGRAESGAPAGPACDAAHVGPAATGAGKTAKRAKHAAAPTAAAGVAADAEQQATAKAGPGPAATPKTSQPKTPAATAAAGVVESSSPHPRKAQPAAASTAGAAGIAGAAPAAGLSEAAQRMAGQASTSAPAADTPSTQYTMKRLRPRTSATPAKNGLAHPGAALLSPPARMGGRSWARWQHHVMLSNLKRKASLDVPSPSGSPTKRPRADQSSPFAAPCSAAQRAQQEHSPPGQPGTARQPSLLSSPSRAFRGASQDAADAAARSGAAAQHGNAMQTPGNSWLGKASPPTNGLDTGSADSGAEKPTKASTLRKKQRKAQRAQRAQQVDLEALDDSPPVAAPAWPPLRDMGKTAAQLGSDQIRSAATAQPTNGRHSGQRPHSAASSDGPAGSAGRPSISGSGPDEAGVHAPAEDNGASTAPAVGAKAGKSRKAGKAGAKRAAPGSPDGNATGAPASAAAADCLQPSRAPPNGGNGRAEHEGQQAGQAQHPGQQSQRGTCSNSDPEEVRQWLGQSSRLGQFGVSVPRWDTVDDATVKKAQQIVRASAPPKRKVVDEWDQEYDKGKTKKVRGVKNDAWDASGNMFQAAASAKGASGGSHHGGRGKHRGGRGGHSPGQGQQGRHGGGGGRSRGRHGRGGGRGRHGGRG